MEPNYKEMFEELVALIEEEHESACELYHDFEEEYIASGMEHLRSLAIFYDGAACKLFNLKTSVDRIKSENGLR